MSVPSRILNVTKLPTRRTTRVGRAEIARAVPAGAGLTRSGKSFLAALEADPLVCAMRSHGRRNLMAVAGVYAAHVSRRSGACWPGHDRVQAATGLGPSTVKRHVRWLREHGYLGTVRPGSTPATRRGARPGAGNEAAVYCLALPRSPRCPGASRPKSEPPTSRRRKSLLLENYPRARTRAGTAAQSSSRPQAWRGGILGRVPLPSLHAIAGPYSAAGWTPADLRYAIDHRPDGSPHWQTSAVRNPGGWVRHRLGQWRLPTGELAASRSRQLQLAADAHRRRAAEQDRYAPIAARAAMIRATYATATEVAAPQRPWTSPARRQRGGRALVGWAAGGRAHNAGRSLAPSAAAQWRRDPEWDALCAAAAAAVEAAESAQASPGVPATA